MSFILCYSVGSLCARVNDTSQRAPTSNREFKNH